ncbi:MAG: FAD:protein FMN transferase [Phycisphaerales bacterium]|nr:MAG: FAD:protein FMN transferase [Phycisphaerales bacterium]
MSDSETENAYGPARPHRVARAHRFAHHAMACTWEGYFINDDPDYAQQAMQAVFDEIDRLEQEFSRFIPHSDVARINALAPGQSVRVGIETMECLILAERIRLQTGGAFDVAFRSTPRDASEAAPDSQARDTTGTRRDAVSRSRGVIELDHAERLVTVRQGAVNVDLGALGKGYAIDQAIKMLEDWGFEQYLLHAGQSTVYSRGTPPGESAWQVSLRHPQDPKKVLGQVGLRDQALSGTGRILHGPHIIDPRTGEPAHGAAGSWASAASAAESDAMSTAFLVLAPHQVGEYCARHSGVAAIVCVGLEPEPEMLQFGSTLHLEQSAFGNGIP